MRADRLVAIVMLLQSHGRLTVADLAARTEVSQRTVLRDVEALTIAGIPVRTLPGPGGGVELPPTYRSGLSALNPPEVMTLLLSGSSQPLQQLGRGVALHQAQRKLLATLPEAQRRDAERWRSRVFLDGSAWSLGAQASRERLATVEEAVWTDRRLRLTYRTPDGRVGDRTVDPLGLVARSGSWYLVARKVEGAGERDASLRSYRVSRILACQVTGPADTRPDGFDLESAWRGLSDATRASWATVAVTVRLSPEAMPLVTRVFGENALDDLVYGEPGPDGWFRVEVGLPSLEAAASRLLSFGEHVEVVAPEELRAEMRRLAGTLSERHRP